MDKPLVELKDIMEAPNLQEMKDVFGVSEKDVIIAYGDTIYTPDCGLSRDLIVHELVHCKRQGLNKDSAKRWYELYMRDVNFRLNEEVLAYKAQYEYCCRVYKDKNRQTKILVALAGQLASSQYGNIITLQEAMEKIK